MAVKKQLLIDDYIFRRPCKFMIKHIKMVKESLTMTMIKSLEV